jgi:hypothetical protein
MKMMVEEKEGPGDGRRAAPQKRKGYRRKADARMTNANASLIAPCGLNCRICRAYIRKKKACRGCRGDDRFKSKTCAACPIKNCKKLAEGSLHYCIACDQFPCGPMNRLEKRYTSNYSVSPFDNLMQIKKCGAIAFVKNENVKWRCPQCGKMLCMHKGQCESFGV